MKRFELEGTLRDITGKTATRLLRRQGLIPCALYKGGEATHFVAEEYFLNKIIYTPEVYLVDIKLGDSVVTCIMRDRQFEPVHDHLLHVDFVAVPEDRPLETPLPVKLKGTSEGVLAGGKLVQKLRLMRVRGDYRTLPDYVQVDVSDLKLGRSLKVRDLSYPDFEIIMAPDIPVCTIEIPRALRQARGPVGPN